MDELELDISPFNSYKELRICSQEGNMMENMLSGLESQVLLEVALSGTGITESEESRYNELYFTLTNDYLFTRLRGRSFQDDDF